MSKAKGSDPNEKSISILAICLWQHAIARAGLQGSQKKDQCGARDEVESMRIIHVANFSNNKYGADLYSTDRKISAGMIRNGHFVYDFSYRDVYRNESLFQTTRLCTNTVNKKLIEACDIICPDLLLLGHTEMIEAAILQAVKDHHPAARIDM